MYFIDDVYFRRVGNVRVGSQKVNARSAGKGRRGGVRRFSRGIDSVRGREREQDSTTRIYVCI